MAGETFSITAAMTKPLQKQWTNPVSKNIFGLRIEQFTTDFQKACLQGVNCQGAGDWFIALPSNPLGLCLQGYQFRIASSIRMGAPVSTKHRCLGGTTLDFYGTHALVCPRITSRLLRHTMCKDVIRDAFKTAQFPSHLNLLLAFSVMTDADRAAPH